MSSNHQVVIVGMGLAALSTAARLTELGISDIAVYANGFGGTPYIAAINFVLPGNPHGDTPEQYAKDMLAAGYDIGNPELVYDMANHTVEGYELLRRWGVEFAHNEDGAIKLRHVSGHTYPRSLCCTTDLIGNVMVEALVARLKERGVEFVENAECVGLLSDGKRVGGAVFRLPDGELHTASANVVVAAWGGVGNLLGTSTYPADVKGNTLAIAYEAGAKLVDIEFLEYEPLVSLAPPGAVGEPCPTAMLGEGAHLLNSKGERFLLKVRPQGEGGSPKTLLNKEIWHEISAGNSTPHGGVWVDLRHIDADILNAYPWFYNRLRNSGLDLCKQPLEVGPMPHSFAGGVLVDGGYQSTVQGLYAVGEACGGVHGACRSAGNAASQAVLSGLLCAEAAAKSDFFTAPPSVSFDFHENKALADEYMPKLQRIASEALGVYRSGDMLDAAAAELDRLLDGGTLSGDTGTAQTARTIRLMVEAASLRKETRGNQRRLDYPACSDAFQREIIIS